MLNAGAQTLALFSRLVPNNLEGLVRKRPSFYLSAVFLLTVYIRDASSVQTTFIEINNPPAKSLKNNNNNVTIATATLSLLCVPLQDSILRRLTSCPSRSSSQKTAREFSQFNGDLKTTKHNYNATDTPAFKNQSN